MALNRRLQQVRDVFAMREHYGWAHYLAQKAARLPGPGAKLAQHLHERLARHTDHRSAAFDQEHGTDTFARSHVRVRESLPPEQASWGYGPVNQDFFREIMRAIPYPLATFTFIDVGAGKGAALMLASEFGFRRYVGVDINEHILEVGRANISKYNASTGRGLDPEWVRADFMKWAIPHEDALLFFNNPLPADLSLAAVQHVEKSLEEAPRRLLLVYRKAPDNVGAYLSASTFWQPVRLAPYWRVYASPTLALSAS